MGRELAGALARFEAILCSAQEQLAQAKTNEDKRIASAKVEIFEGAVDLARGQLLPEPCRDALKLLLEHASDEWLARHPSPGDPNQRRDFVSQTIELQVLASLFRPNLDVSDEFEADERQPGAGELGGALAAAWAPLGSTPSSAGELVAHGAGEKLSARLFDGREVELPAQTEAEGQGEPGDPVVVFFDRQAPIGWYLPERQVGVDLR